jgi:adenylate cyclase
MSPTELMGMTNRYFEVIVKAVDESEGYVDNFIGDAVMALWGAPAKTANHASNAIRCAIAIQQRVPELNATINMQAFGGFEIKIGISSGPAIVGNVGTSRRFSYTALGATVNLAARLETACATLGCNIVVDNATMAAVADQYLFCELDSYLPKGISVAIAVYTPIAQLENVTEGQRLAVERYESALALYRDGKSAQAICIWDAMASSDGDQCLAGAARFMSRRAETHRRSHSNNPE